MDDILVIISPYALAIFTALISLVIFMIKKVFERIQKLEDKQCNNITRSEGRDMMEEKIEPVQRQIDSINTKLDKIIDILLKL